MHADRDLPEGPDEAWGLRLIGARIRRERLRVGLSQASLAERAGMHQSTISRLEAGVLGGLRLQRMALIECVLAGRDVYARHGERIDRERRAAFVRWFYGPEFAESSESEV